MTSLDYSVVIDAEWCQNACRVRKMRTCWQVWSCTHHRMCIYLCIVYTVCMHHVDTILCVYTYVSFLILSLPSLLHLPLTFYLYLASSKQMPPPFKPYLQTQDSWILTRSFFFNRFFHKENNKKKLVTLAHQLWTLTRAVSLSLK